MMQRLTVLLKLLHFMINTYLHNAAEIHLGNTDEHEIIEQTSLKVIAEVKKYL